LLSEVPLGVAAHPARFLIRNRLIASLASGTLVVEAANRSGSIRTALDAAKYHRPVFATPGPITSPASEGCHRLIIERVAELVTAPNEIRELLQSPDGFLPPESS
jgi:DNA processing protein